MIIPSLLKSSLCIKFVNMPLKQYEMFFCILVLCYNILVLHKLYLWCLLQVLWRCILLCVFWVIFNHIQVSFPFLSSVYYKYYGVHFVMYFWVDFNCIQVSLLISDITYFLHKVLWCIFLSVSVAGLNALLHWEIWFVCILDNVAIKAHPEFQVLFFILFYCNPSNVDVCSSSHVLGDGLFTFAPPT